MIHLLSWITTVIFMLVFGIILVIFHPLQMIARAISYHWHKKVVDVMVGCLDFSLAILGSPIRYEGSIKDLPTDRPVIIVSNHQSMFDIPAIGWVLRRHHPKYVAKKELGKGIPSISYNIRHGGSVMIDRKDRKQAITALGDFGEYIGKNNFAACIFPEGTRSRDGFMRPFKPVGLLKLLKTMPDAIIVPVVMQNFWKIERYKMRPIPFGMGLTCTILEPIERTKTDKEIIEEVELRIKSVAEYNLLQKVAT